MKMFLVLALAGAQMAQAAGLEHVTAKGDLSAVVKQHTARMVVCVVPVHIGLHGIRLVPGQIKHRRGVPSDPHSDGLAQPLVVVHIGAQGG